MSQENCPLLKLLAECRVDTFRSGGPGGQHQNTTDSAVRLTHFPSGIVVVCRESRSQITNRDLALKKLQAKLIERRKVQKKRIATKPKRSSVIKRLDKKKLHSKKKSDRRQKDF